MAWKVNTVERGARSEEQEEEQRAGSRGHREPSLYPQYQGHYITRDRPGLRLRLGRELSFGFGFGLGANFKCLAWHLAPNVYLKAYKNLLGVEK